jgi:hypothetical protein
MTDNPTTKFLLDRVATVYAQLSDPEQVAALRQTPGALHELEREYDDLRAAMIGIRHPEEDRVSLWARRCLFARLPHHHWFKDGQMFAN